MLKRHSTLKQKVDEYAEAIQQLADRAQKMLAEDHPDGYVMSLSITICIDLSIISYSLPNQSSSCIEPVLVSVGIRQWNITYNVSLKLLAGRLLFDGKVKWISSMPV